MTIISESDSQTQSLGKRLAKLLKEGDILLLEGELGGGKTTFVKGVLKGLGYKKDVLSPSFTLVRRYKIKKTTINHIDLYRLDKKNLNSLNIEEYLYQKNSISIIEWGKKIVNYLDKYLIVRFLFLDMKRRKLSFSQKGYNKDKFKNLKESLDH